MSATFDIEAILKPFVDDVRESLKGFDSRLSNATDTIREIERSANRARALGGLVAPYSAPAGDGATARKGLAFDYEGRAALADYICKGTVISGAVDAEGGFLVPLMVANEIERLIELQSPVRRAARVVTMEGRDVRFPVGNAAMASGWVAEKGGRSTTASPDFFGVQPPGGELYAAPEVTLAALEDAAVLLEAFIETAVIDEFARNESDAFINGDGTDKPRGFLAGPAPVATADATRAFGTLQYVPTGAASTLGTDLIGKLIAMIFAVKAGYRQAPGCGWMMSTAVLSDIANLKDTTGRPLFLPSMREGVPGLLMGYPVFEAEHLPAVGANAFPVAFGNWPRGYVIGDRTPLSVLRDPYSKRGFLTLYFRKRVHGAVLNSEAIKLLKVAAS
jgi:HK97 family phage major capsid protein